LLSLPNTFDGIHEALQHSNLKQYASIQIQRTPNTSAVPEKANNTKILTSVDVNLEPPEMEQNITHNNKLTGIKMDRSTETNITDVYTPDHNKQITRIVWSSMSYPLRVGVFSRPYACMFKLLSQPTSKACIHLELPV